MKDKQLMTIMLYALFGAFVCAFPIYLKFSVLRMPFTYREETIVNLIAVGSFFTSMFITIAWRTRKKI